MIPRNSVEDDIVPRHNKYADINQYYYKDIQSTEMKQYKQHIQTEERMGYDLNINQDHYVEDGGFQVNRSPITSA